MKKHNFSAGPSILSQYCIDETAKAIKDLNGIGLSVAEISHRSKEFQAVMDESIALFKELLKIPEGYHILFLGGGASMQFCMVPYNLMKTKAAYLNTGAWSAKAIKEGNFFGEVVEVASSKDKTYSYLPKGYTIPSDADYFHITTNNTIYGTEIKEDIDSPVPLVADMSSDIFSRPIDVSKYAIIYGGAQKNLAPSGLAFVIIKDGIIGKTGRKIPSMLNYQTHIDNGSMFNTPPVVPIYSALMTLRWYKQQGGVEGMHKINVDKAALLYNEIERNKLFVCPVTDVNDRSIMNVTWVMAEKYKELEAEFLEFAVSKGMSGIKGHRSVGGYRASIYNAMPVDSVKALISCMQEFEISKA